MRQLVNSWVQAEAEDYGNGLAQAIRHLNQERGMKLTHSRLAEWRNGRYTPSQSVISYMLYQSLPWVLRRAGIQATEKQIDALEELLWKTNITDGQRYIEFP